MKKKLPPSLDNARQYYGQRAADVYEERRVQKTKWKLEYECLESMLQPMRGRVLDVPVGTGRFLQMYKYLSLEAVGVDYKLPMLELARTKYPDAVLEQGDITKLQYAVGAFDTVVCVRLLHLVTSREVPQILGELLRVARQDVIVTIHLGDAAYSKGRSQVHTRDVLDCVQSPWVMSKCKLIMNEKGMPYYMIHFRRQ